VAVALELDADHAAGLAEPREDVVEAAVEREDAAVLVAKAILGI
jgi:hypothetical protein